jgi:hypothetical protein
MAGLGLWWELRQNRRIAEAETAAYRTNRDLGQEVRWLRRVVDRLALLNRAVWELLAEASGIDEGRLEEKVREIDLRDGSLDGKAPAETRACVSCGRTLLQGHRRCSWCGAVDPSPDPFDVSR